MMPGYWKGFWEIPGHAWWKENYPEIVELVEKQDYQAIWAVWKKAQREYGRST
jgi:hypothetical protein